MRLRGEQLKEVSFPVGGIGAGCLGIDGHGRLKDWEIFNHPGKGLSNGCSHFSVRVEQGGAVIAARVLNGDYQGDLRGIGNGPSRDDLAGFPHFQDVELDGSFPVAEFTFRDSEFPGEIMLSAWSPFIPGESDMSSMPISCWEITYHNTTSEALVFTAAGVLANPWTNLSGDNQIIRQDGLTAVLLQNHFPKDSLEYGELALTTDAQTVSFQEYWYRGDGVDNLDVYWKDLGKAGLFEDRHYPMGEKLCCLDHGMLAGHVVVAPGERRTIRFAITWYVPNRSNDWDVITEEDLARDGIQSNQWRNYYASLCAGAVHCARKLFTEYEKIRQLVFLFAHAIHDSTLPEPVIAGVAENLSVLVSPTCLRLEDGTFWGWEGVFLRKGICMGTCQHVWNYAQALSLLFPDLERSIRRSQALYGFDDEGVWRCRIPLPLGRRYHDKGRGCVDGTFGEVMKIYREWKVSGDTEWLKSMWFAVKKAFEFTWSPANPDRWDPKRTGVISGRQHHTLDRELFGPSGWLNGHYLGALKAAAEMAPHCHDEDFGDECKRLFCQGKEWSDKHLFNGEYYIQQVEITNPDVLRAFFKSGESLETCDYWSSEHGQIKYQIGEGCCIDAHLGQWYASLYGLGDILSSEHIHQTLNAIYRYNYHATLRNFFNPWRTFALNDEGGCIIASWPSAAERPAIPVCYYSETMTGFEWAAAAHMIMVGDVENGEKLAATIRQRFNGNNRNPWNEFECGNNYARSMASYAMLQAYSGFEYDMARRRIAFKPVIEGAFRCFWSLGKIWGVFERLDEVQRIRVLHGSEAFEMLGIEGKQVTINGKLQSGRRDGKDWHFDDLVTLVAGDVIECR